MLFGWGAVVLAPGLVFGGILIAFAGRLGWQVRWAAIVVGELLFWAFLAFIHLGLADPLPAALAGRGGGLVGWATGQALADVIGATAARVLVAIGGLAAAILLWRTLPPDWTGGVTHRLLAAWWSVRAAVGREAQDAGRLGGEWVKRISAEHPERGAAERKVESRRSTLSGAPQCAVEGCGHPLTSPLCWRAVARCCAPFA